ncbi:MAG: sulfatase-like hydrolase/transferase [Methylocella sp.]
MKKMPIDDLGANKNSIGGNTSPTSSAPAAIAVNSPTRRDLLQVGAGLAVAASGGWQALAAPAVKGKMIKAQRARNIIVLMTDQERHHMHWPPGWAEQNLPSLQRLKRNGLYFQRAYTAACECSPSRGVMQTGRFAPVNRIPSTTVLWPGLPHKDHQANIASLLTAHAGYDVVWKGKWHLSYASNAAQGNGGEHWGPADIKAMEDNWGWSGWNPPDSGNAIQELQGTAFGIFNGNNTAGGGNPNNDGRYVSGDANATPGQIRGVGGKSVVDFLKGRKGSSKPFCMFVSLVNPHDIGVYPGNRVTPPAWQQIGYRREDFAHLGIKLPPNYADDLSTKPRIQKVARDNYDRFAPLDGPEAHEDYVNFYAYLHKVVDKHITTVLDTLEETGLMDNTIILRFADHGEGGLSHGMREKSYTAYEEMIHIPLIVHNRRLYPEPRETTAFYDHRSLLPTILDLAGVPDAESYGIAKSIVPVMQDPSKSVQDHTLFSYDDVFFVPATAPGGHIRAMREGDWTYAVYFAMDGSGWESGKGEKPDPTKQSMPAPPQLEYELYYIQSDPDQMHNLLYGTPTEDARKEWARLHDKLTKHLFEAGNLPNGFQWPIWPAQA